MADDQARITILCDRATKLEVKRLAAENDFEWLNEAYLEIFKLGIEAFKKNKGGKA